MYSALYEKLPDAGAYLDKLGLTGRSLPLSPESLDLLIYTHLHRIPFENLDVFILDKCPQLGVSALFEKIIKNRRGGYCFELNGLFFSLLQALGFQVYPVQCRVIVGKSFLPPNTHRATIAVIDGKKYYCDVGYGGSAPAYALCFDGAPSPDGFFLAENGPETLMCRTKDGVREDIISFRDIPADNVDFIPLNFHIAKAPGSFFRSKTVVNLRTDDGSVSIDGDILRRHSPAGVTETKINGKAELIRTLKYIFCIDFDY